MSLPAGLPSRRKDKDIAMDTNIPDLPFKKLSDFEPLGQNLHLSLSIEISRAV